jgi:hypothetical protein
MIVTSTNPFAPSIEFDASSISDNALADLRGLVVRRVLPAAGAFGSWLHNWCDAEQSRRQRGGEPFVRVKHDLAMPPAPTWTNAELGEALEVVNRLSYAVTDASVGQLVDRLVLVITGEAASRLKGLR